MIPTCFGGTPGLLRACRRCLIRRLCREERETRPQSLAEIAAEIGAAAVRDREGPREWGVINATRFLTALATEFDVPHNYENEPYALLGETYDVVTEVCNYCKRQGLSPALWFRAQFVQLADWARENTIYLSPQTFHGKKAVARYRTWVLSPDYRTWMARSPDLPFLSVERDLGRLTLISYPEQVPQELIDGLHQPGWDPNDWDAVRESRLVAAADLADEGVPGLSERVAPPPGRWKWREMARFFAALEGRP